MIFLNVNADYEHILKEKFGMRQVRVVSHRTTQTNPATFVEELYQTKFVCRHPLANQGRVVSLVKSYHKDASKQLYDRPSSIQLL